MPKVVAPLTDVAVRNLKTPGLYSVGGVPGLKLQVTSQTARSWILRASVAGKPRDIGIGGYPLIGLKQARELASELHAQIKAGMDPVAERQKVRDQLRILRSTRKTFDQCAEDYITSIEAQWKSPKQAPQWRSSLETYASPIIGKMPVSEISTEHILCVLEPIWRTKTETATRVRGRIENILSYATTRGFRAGDNPARLKGHLDTLLPQATALKKVKHQPALPYVHVGKFMAHIRSQETITSRALEFLLLTATRSGEVRGATWGEIDLNAKQWVIPAERMKARRQHIVPLSDSAIALLSKLPRGCGSNYLFPGTKSQSLSDMTISKLVKTLHKQNVSAGGDGYIDPHQDNRVVTPHGLRSTFRDWAADQSNFSREVIEHALAHQLKDKAEAAYQRGSSLPKRIKLMEAWSRWCDSSTHSNQTND